MFKGFALYNCRRPHVPSLSPEQAGVRQTTVKVRKGGHCLLHLCTLVGPLPTSLSNVSASILE